jgi:uridine kinase
VFLLQLNPIAVPPLVSGPRSPRAVRLIAITGGSGAGKGWLVERLCALFGGQACHLQLDDFYRDLSHLPPHRRSRVNFDLPRAIDWESAKRVLRACRAGRAARVPHYDFATYCRLPSPASWRPRPIVFVDGLWLLRSPGVRAFFDLKIFLATPARVRRSRRLARDVAERGYTVAAVEDRLRTTVMPLHNRYVEPQRKWADIVLAQPFQEAEVFRLADRLWRLDERAAPLSAGTHAAFRAKLAGLLMPLH